MRTVLVVLFSITLAVLLIILPFVSAASLLVMNPSSPNTLRMSTGPIFSSIGSGRRRGRRASAFSALFAKLVESSMPQFFDLIYGRADNLTLNYLEILPEFLPWPR